MIVYALVGVERNFGRLRGCCLSECDLEMVPHRRCSPWIKRDSGRKKRVRPLCRSSYHLTQGAMSFVRTQLRRFIHSRITLNRTFPPLFPRRNAVVEVLKQVFWPTGVSEMCVVFLQLCRYQCAVVVLRSFNRVFRTLRRERMVPPTTRIIHDA